MPVDLSRGNVVVAAERDIEVPLVVAQVEVSLSSIVEDKDLSVLGRCHGTGIDVHVGVNLDGRDSQTQGLEEQTSRRGCAAQAIQESHDGERMLQLLLSSLCPSSSPMTPLPMPEMTPPLTTMNLVIAGGVDVGSCYEEDEVGWAKLK